MSKSKLDDWAWRLAYEDYMAGTPVSHIYERCAWASEAYASEKMFYRAFLAYQNRNKLPERD